MKMLKRLAMPGGNASRAGRTLVEVMVSVAIMLMSGVILTGMISAGLRQSGTFHYEDQRVYPVRDGIDMLLKDLRLTQGAYQNCGVSGRLALAIQVNENDLRIFHYYRDSQNRLVRSAYRDASCSALLSESVIVHQIVQFGFELVDPDPLHLDTRLRVRLTARSPDGTLYTIDQLVTGRVLGQP